jgi:hypothetical protein
MQDVGGQISHPRACRLLRSTSQQRMLQVIVVDLIKNDRVMLIFPARAAPKCRF